MSIWRISHWETRYTDKWCGKPTVHRNDNNRSDGVGWTKKLAEDNGCKAECYEVYSDGTRKHVASFGDKE